MTIELLTFISIYSDGGHIQTDLLPKDKKNDSYCNKDHCWHSYLDIFCYKSGRL